MKKTVLTQVLELIDSEVIRLSKVKGEHKKVSGSCADQLVILKMKINNLNLIQDENQWIKINSEADLPSHTEDVLINVGGQVVQAFCLNGRWKGSYDLRDNVQDGWGGDFEISGQSLVTHWMPLPSSPI